MEKIKFEDGQLVTPGYVEIDGVQYEVHEAEYEGNTPLSPFVLNTIQDNIENELTSTKTTEISEEIIVEDACACNAKLKVFGKTVQEGEPSPTNPKTIRNVGDNIDLKIENKNKLKGLSTSVSDNKYWAIVNQNPNNFKPLENGWARFNYDNTSGNSNVFINAKVNLDAIDLKPNTEYTFVIEIRNSTISEDASAFFVVVSNNTSTAFQETINIGYSQINSNGIFKCTNITKENLKDLLYSIDTYLRLGIGTKGTVEARISLFEGDIDISNFQYVEHKEQNTTFPLEEGQVLPDGDYLDEDGIHQNINTVQFNTTDFYINMFAEGFCYIGNKSNGFIWDYKNINAICTHFENANNENIINNTTAKNLLKNNEFAFRMGDTKDRVYFKNSSLTTLEDWQNFFNDNDVIFQYEIEETITPYTNEQQKAYDKLQNLLMYENYTKISCLNEIKPDMKLTYYYNNNLNNTYAKRLDKVEEDVKNLEKNIITTTINAKHTITSSDYEKLTLINNAVKIGNKLSVVDGSIIIGKGVSYIKIFAQIEFFDGLTSGKKSLSINKNNTISGIISTTIPTTYSTMNIAGLLLEVQEGDIISLHVKGAINDTIFNGNTATFMTVEVI